MDMGVNWKGVIVCKFYLNLEFQNAKCNDFGKFFHQVSTASMYFEPSPSSHFLPRVN